jgi:hypothetical protein
MILLSIHNQISGFDEEEEAETEGEAGIDDALLSELDDEALDDEALDGVLDPLLKDPILPVEEEDEDEALKEEGAKLFDDDDEEEDVDYDSFDDRDEL